MALLLTCFVSGFRFKLSHHPHVAEGSGLKGGQARVSRWRWVLLGSCFNLGARDLQLLPSGGRPG